jgi:nicotinate-nucleotide adenylyltransferase
MVYPRRGYTDELPYNNMSRIETPIIEVSSTFIRESVEKGRDVRFFLPGGIYDDVCREVRKMKKLQ